MTRLRIQDFTDDCFVLAQAEVTPGQQAPIPRPYTPVRFGSTSIRTTGTGMPFDQWIFDSSSRSEPTHRIDYRPANEQDVYLFLEQNTAVDIRPYLGSAAQYIVEMRLDLQAGALPVLRATFVMGPHDPVAPVLTRLLELPDGPIRLINHTLRVAVDSVATLEAEFVIDNRTSYRTFVSKPETNYAPEPVPQQLPEARGPETRFREWSASLERSQRGR